MMLTKSMVAMLGGVLLSGLSACASEPQQDSAAVVAKEERCMVTGSNVPKRDCRNDVKVLPPSAVESVMPVMPGPGNRP